MSWLTSRVYICHCGTNIAGTVDVEAVTDFAAGLDGVAVARHYAYMCSDPGQALIKDDVRDKGLDRVVVASCSPLMHETTFRRACSEAGLNPFLFQMTNIREHCAWVTDDRAKATRKAKALVSAAVHRVRLNEPLETRHVQIKQSALVVGGGIAGIEAALRLVIHTVLDHRADYGHFTILWAARHPSLLVFTDEYDFVNKTLTKLGFAPAQNYVTLEARMHCGIGKCGRCHLGDKLICMDGPVFSMKEVNGLLESFL